MEIIEIWIPELVAVLFLVLPLFRPFIKKLWYLDGLAWLPVIALVIIAGIFPAYGFRPECLPILLFTFVYSIANILPVISGVSSRSNDTFRDRGPLVTMLAFILLGAATFPMFAFSAKVDTRLKGEVEFVEIIEAKKTRYNAGNYYIRVYGTVQADRPLIVLAAPEIGSAASVDLVCRELYKKNYTIVTYYFRGNDLFKRYAAFPAQLVKHWHIVRNASVFASAHKQGKIREEERRAEIEYLLSRLPSLLNAGKGSLPPLLLVGYGTSGSALAYLAGDDRFISRYDNVLGTVAIESRLWSSYLPVLPAMSVPKSGGKIQRYWTGFINRLNTMRPQRVSRSGLLPGAEVSGNTLPVLYLISGRALDVPQGQKPYRAVFDTLRSGSGPVALAAIEGAGPLDYQDYPFTHPIYSFFLPGLKGAQQSENPISDTASIIGNFASQLLEHAGHEQTAAPPVIPPRHVVYGSLYVESKGLPGFRL